jgi:hypothetical protein
LNFGPELNGKIEFFNLAKELMSKEYMSSAIIDEDVKTGKYTLVQNDHDVVIVRYTFLNLIEVKVMLPRRLIS